MEDVRNALGHRCPAPPDMVAEAMREHHVGLEATDDFAQFPYRDGMHPVGDHFHLQALLAQLFDLRLIRAAFAAQHQQNFEAWGVQCRQTEVNGDLGGSREAASNKVKNSNGGGYLIGRRSSVHGSGRQFACIVGGALTLIFLRYFSAAMTWIPAYLFKTVVKLVQPAELGPGAAYESATPVQVQGGADRQVTGYKAIPKILWTYWNHPQPDFFVHECIQSWRLQCPDYEVRLVHPDNLNQYVETAALPANFLELHPTKQSDWIRLYLVARFGGYWLDASTLLTRSLDWMQEQAGRDTEFTGFFLEKFTTNANSPVIESWAFGAQAGSAFITAWQREFHQALIVEGTQAYLQRLEAQAGWLDIRQNIGDPHYLLIHITAQQVLRGRQYSQLALFKAEDSAYYYHRALRWKWYLLYPQLCRVKGPKVSAPIVKLRGGERRHFTEMFKSHGGAVPGSTWYRALHPEQ